MMTIIIIVTAYLISALLVDRFFLGDFYFRKLLYEQISSKTFDVKVYREMEMIMVMTEDFTVKYFYGGRNFYATTGRFEFTGICFLPHNIYYTLRIIWILNAKYKNLTHE